MNYIYSCFSGPTIPQAIAILGVILCVVGVFVAGLVSVGKALFRLFRRSKSK